MSYTHVSPCLFAPATGSLEGEGTCLVSFIVFQLLFFILMSKPEFVKRFLWSIFSQKLGRFFFEFGYIVLDKQGKLVIIIFVVPSKKIWIEENME